MNRIDELLASMTLEEKAQQLTQVNAVCLRRESRAELTGLSETLGISETDFQGVGSTLNFTYDGEMEKIQKGFMEKNPKKIPLLFMQDVVHGYRTVFPIPLAMGCSFDLELAEQCAKMSAVEARLHGVHVTFSPMVDLVRDARWGRVLETTGEDPWLNGEMGKAFIRGYHKGGLACCVKHFAAYGAAEAGMDYNTTELSDHALREFYLRSYEACMQEKPELVMSSFNQLNGVPVNANRELLVERLRKEWGFDGVLISDYNAIREMIHHGYLETEKECACIAANNEIDMEMCSGTYIKYLPDLVREGKVPQETVDRMVRRVLELKEKLRLLDDPLIGVDYEKGREVSSSQTHRKIARQAAEKSAVLLKNDGVLPLNRKAKVVLIGPFVDETRILGAWRCEGKLEEVITVQAGLETYLGHPVPAAHGCSDDLLETQCNDLPAALSIAKGADVIIACVGEPMRHSGEGASRAEISVPQAQIQLLTELKKLGKPVAAVLFGGRPQVLTELEPLVDAILCVWMPGTEGGNAIANLLYGEVNPCGKLTMSFPRATGQCPIYYNHFSTGRPKKEDTLRHSIYSCSYRDVVNAPLYPFGHGLAYTQFRISDLKLSADHMLEDQTINASVLVENIGNRDGEEVVQLYIHDHFASMVRPIRELKGFKKVFIPAGKSVQVEFEITEQTLKFYDANGVLTAEPGSFSLMIGNSSENVLKADFRYDAVKG